MFVLPMGKHCHQGSTDYQHNVRQRGTPHHHQSNNDQSMVVKDWARVKEAMAALEVAVA